MGNNLGKKILGLVGGESNVRSVAKCATRLRFSLNDDSKANVNAINDLDGVISVVKNSNQFQVVIGTNVANIYNELIENTSFNTNEEVKGEKKGVLSTFMETVSALFTPLLPLLAGSGLLRGLVLLCTQIGILSDQSSTYFILTAASTAVFYFLPLLLAFTASRKFGCNPYVAVAIMGALIMPDFLNLMGETGNGTMTTFLGLPIVLMSYTSTVIPAVLSIYIFSKLETILKKMIPTSVHLMFVPLISLLVMVPLTAGVMGPLGVYLGNGIASIVSSLVNFNGWIAGAVVGGFWNILVIFGIHWAVNPIMIQNISVNGFDYIVPFTAATNFGMAGATFGFYLKTKNQKMKQFSLSALLSIFFAGITEPAIYGVGVKYKKPLVAAFIGGTLGGAFMGGMGVKAYAFVFGGLTTIPAFAGPTLGYYVIGLAICFFVSMVVSMVLGIDEEIPEVNHTNNFSNGEISLPIKGEVKDIKECSDQTFSSEMMGKGVVILPNEGKVYAPFDGDVTLVFDTLHAIGLKGDNGVELLIHIGIDTVELEGKPFKTLIKEGQTIRKGDLLMEFDIDMIKQGGKSIETPVVITNSNNFIVTFEEFGNVPLGTSIMKIK